VFYLLASKGYLIVVLDSGGAEVAVRNGWNRF
jgi:hypothetical protein